MISDIKIQRVTPKELNMNNPAFTTPKWVEQQYYNQ